MKSVPQTLFKHHGHWWGFCNFSCSFKWIFQFYAHLTLICETIQCEWKPSPDGFSNRYICMMSRWPSNSKWTTKYKQRDGQSNNTSKLETLQLLLFLTPIDWDISNYCSWSTKIACFFPFGIMMCAYETILLSQAIDGNNWLINF